MAHRVERMFVPLQSTQQGGRCYRVIRYLCEDGVVVFICKVLPAHSRLLGSSVPAVAVSLNFGKSTLKMIRADLALELPFYVGN